MLRSLLTMLLVGVVFTATAQDASQVKTLDTRATSISKTGVVHVEKATTGNEVGTALRPSEAEFNSSNRQAVGTLIGNTTYDLQSNYGNCDRIANVDGTIYATWTRSTSFDIGAPDRGTGFNMSMDGGDTWNPAPEERLEGDTRVGWPNVGVTASGRIFSVAHTGDAGMNFCYSDDGGDTWTNTGVGSILGDLEGVWPRTGNDGDHIQAVISRQTEAAGISGGLLHFRSLDGGDTWEGPFELPNLSGLYSDMQADSYYVDVNGSNVAIIIGQYASNVVLYESDDFGDTWNINVIREVSDPFLPTDPTTEDSLDPVAVAGGGVTVIIADDGTTHVWFDRVYNYLAEGQGGGPFYLPNSSCLMYWNSDMAEPMVIGETVRADYNGDGETLIGTGDTADDFEVQSYGVTIVGQPSAGIDADGNLYVAFSSQMDGDVEDPAVGGNTVGRQYRDVLMIKSTDGGATWIGPYNVTNSPDEEDVYPSIARTVDTHVHLVYQNDALTGTAVQNANGQGHFGDLYVDNGIYYIKIPVDDIVTPDPDVNTSPVVNWTSRPILFSQDCEEVLSRFEALHALDYPDGDVTDIIDWTGTLDVTTPAELAYTIRLEVTDSDGNTYEEIFFDEYGDEDLVTVLEDVDAPLLDGNPSEFVVDDVEGIVFTNSLFALFDTIDVLQDSAYEDLGAVAWDESEFTFGCNIIITTDNPVDTSTPGEYTVTYTAEDIAGNISEPVTRVINVIGEDLVPPTILVFDEDGNEFADGAVVNEDFSSSQTFGGFDFFAYDNVDLDITDLVLVDGEVDLGVIGSYDLTYSVTDASGNATTLTVTVVVADSQAPAINLIPPASQPIVLQCEQQVDFTNPSDNSIGTLIGFTAVDNVDGDLTVEVDVDASDFCPLCAGSYEITYNVCDSNGNCADEVTRTVIVVAPCAIDCSGECFVGINDPAIQAAIEVYPNPASNVINIELNEAAANAQVRTFNTAGQLMKVMEMNSGSASMDISELPTGVYYLEVATENGTAIEKIVVER